MSDTNETTNRPTHTIYQVLGDGKDAVWLRIGAAWMHGDSRGAQLSFNSFPLTGRIVMRERKDEQPETAAQPAAAGERAENGGQQ